METDEQVIRDNCLGSNGITTYTPLVKEQMTLLRGCFLSGGAVCGCVPFVSLLLRFTDFMCLFTFVLV